MSSAVAIVLAAGKGTRMKSDLPKVLLDVCSRPMIEYVLEALRKGGIVRNVIVVGYRADLVEAALGGQPDIEFVLQEPQLGTGHAVMVCREALAGYKGPVLIAVGDSPMLQKQSVRHLLEAFETGRDSCILGTAYKDDPTGLGRIVRDSSGQFVGIVEEKDATDQQRRITEVNMSTYVFGCQDLFDALEQLKPNNVQSEYYITDCPSILLAAGKRVRALDVLKPCEAMSINTLEELSAVEEILRGNTSS